MDAAERQEAEAILDLYMSALGMVTGFEQAKTDVKLPTGMTL